MTLSQKQTIDARKYISDAPSLLWRIHDLIQADKVFEAEDLIYAVFREKEKDVLAHFREMLPFMKLIQSGESNPYREGYNQCLREIMAAIEKEEKV